MKDLIEKYNFNFKKKFGQNFLKDKNILENIALKSDIDKDTFKTKSVERFRIT